MGLNINVFLNFLGKTSCFRVYRLLVSWSYSTQRYVSKIHERKCIVRRTMSTTIWMRTKFLECREVFIWSWHFEKAEQKKATSSLLSLPLMNSTHSCYSSLLLTNSSGKREAQVDGEMSFRCVQAAPWPLPQHLGTRRFLVARCCASLRNSIRDVARSDSRPSRLFRM